MTPERSARRLIVFLSRRSIGRRRAAKGTFAIWHPTTTQFDSKQVQQSFPVNFGTHHTHKFQTAKELAFFSKGKKKQLAR
jgi:hypothetical protein